MDLKNHIGARVKAARQRKGLTQEQLAEAIDRAVETMSNIERGAMLTGLDTLQRIAVALDTPMTFFFEGVGDMPHLSRARLETELRLQAIAQRLPMRELHLAIALLETLESFDEKKA